MKKTILLSASLIAAVISISTVAQAGSHRARSPSLGVRTCRCTRRRPSRSLAFSGEAVVEEHYATKKPPDVTSRIKASALTEPRRDTRSAPGLLW